MTRRNLFDNGEVGVVQKWGFLGNKIMTNLVIVQTMTYGINVLRFKPISQAR
jgi:hypothetical protein